MPEYLFEIKNLEKTFFESAGLSGFRKTAHRVLKEVSFNIYRGETLGLVGESGSGKTTLGRCLLRFTACEQGRVLFQNEDILQMSPKQFRKIRPRLQMIYQNPFQSLNPRQKLADSIGEVLKYCRKLPRSGREREIGNLLEQVNLSPTLLHRYPSQLSGGQRQRASIARVLAARPIFLVADEPTSSLDASLKWQIIGLLQELKNKFGLTLLLISHDLPLVVQIADRIAVMQEGAIVEIGPTYEVLYEPLHPYTRFLVPPSVANHKKSSISNGDLDFLTFPGGEKSGGCGFTQQCPLVSQICRRERPILNSAGNERKVACHKISNFSSVDPMNLGRFNG